MCLDTTLDCPVLSGRRHGNDRRKNRPLPAKPHRDSCWPAMRSASADPLPDSAFRKRAGTQRRLCGTLSCRIAGVLFGTTCNAPPPPSPGQTLRWWISTRDGEALAGHPEAELPRTATTHYTETVEGAPVNSIIQQRACLAHTRAARWRRALWVNLILTNSMRPVGQEYVDIGRPHGVFISPRVVYQLHHRPQPEKKKLHRPYRRPPCQAVPENYTDISPMCEAQVAMMIAIQARDNDKSSGRVGAGCAASWKRDYPLAAVPLGRLCGEE